MFLFISNVPYQYIDCNPGWSKELLSAYKVELWSVYERERFDLKRKTTKLNTTMGTPHPKNMASTDSHEQKPADD